MKHHSLLLTLLGLSVCFLASAQQKTKIFGDIGIENVNISVNNTPYGTTTNIKGHYELLLSINDKPVELHYSCIGYQDTAVILTPEHLRRESIEISFRMRQLDYKLQEVGIIAVSNFYRSGRNRNITDMVFLDGNIYLLENRPKASSMVVLNTDGVEQAHKDYDQLFEKLYIDAFNDIILVGQDSCLQVYLNEDKDILPVSTFSRELYRSKLLKIACEFNGAYVIKNEVHDKGLYWLKHNHGKTQEYSYVMKDDPNKARHPLCHYLDTLGYIACQLQWMSIQAEYHEVHWDTTDIDFINEGIWDGNLVRLAENPSLIYKIQSYCSLEAKKEYTIMPLVFGDYLQFVDLDNHEIVEIGNDFKITTRRPLKVTSGEKYFKNEFLKDEVTGKAYGLFVVDGMNHLGLYDPITGAVGMGRKASKKIYPSVFKVYGGYAYSVFFDSGSNRGVINRMKIE